VTTTADDLVTLIRDAPDWETGEHYPTAIQYRLRAVLAPYSTQPTVPHRRRDLPPPESNHRAVERSFEERLADAEDYSARLGGPTVSSGQSRRARRRIKRTQHARAQTQLRRRFQQRERDCVEEILRPLREPGSTADASRDASDRCPIPAQKPSFSLAQLHPPAGEAQVVEVPSSSTVDAKTAPTSVSAPTTSSLDFWVVFCSVSTTRGGRRASS